MSLVDPGRHDAPAVVAPAVSRTTIVASLAAHSIVAAALVGVPLFAQVRLPAPSRSIEAYIRAAAVALVPEPLPPGRSSPRPAAPSAPVAPATASPAAAPTEAPTTIGAGEPAAAPAAGVAVGGVPHSGLGEVTGGLPAPPAMAAPPPPPPVTRPLRVGGDIRVPRKLHHVAPIYPPIAAQARISGTVVLDATISPSGDVVDVRILRSVPLLDAAAVTLTVTVHFAQ